MFNRMRWSLPVSLVAFCAVGCADSNPTDPGDGDVMIAAYGAQRLVAAPTALLDRPLIVMVTDARTRKPAADVQVDWHIVQGNGASLEVIDSRTDGQGFSRAKLRLGQTLGTYVVEVRLPYAPQTSTRFEIDAAQTPWIESIEPRSARAGQNVIVRGRNFHAATEHNAVYFGDLRGVLVKSAPDALEVVVPHCIVERQVNVTVRVGALTSPALDVSVSGGGAPLTLNVGDVTAPFAAGDDPCLRLHGVDGGAAYLLLTQNVSALAGDAATFALSGMRGSRGSTELPDRVTLRRANTQLAPEDLELQLRTQDAALFKNFRRADRLPAAYRVEREEPVAGARRSFRVQTREGTYEPAQAVVRFVSKRAVIYQDINAPADGLTDADVVYLGSLFDDVIYPTDVQVFGAPSDVDENERINILLTPAVNAWTPANSTTGFFAGFFTGCDLLTAVECEGSNQGEMLYALVPDPEGRFGMRHTRADILSRLPGILAHELQHAIHVNQRFFEGKAIEAEATWLMEGLAHMAEDTVGGVLLQRGDAAGAATLRRQNYRKTFFMLKDPSQHSAVDFDGTGTIEQRGAAWLLVKYLNDRFGGQVLSQLCRARQASAQLVTGVTGQAWDRLMTDWWLAIYLASDPNSPLAGRINGYANLDLQRAMAMAAPSEAFPLRPARLSGDFEMAGTIVPSAATFAELGVGDAREALNLALSARGHTGQNGNVRLTIVRLR
jgi:hypothetical protein